MNKTLTPSADQSSKPRRLGRGLSALLGEPVAVQIPSVQSPTAPSMVEMKAAAAKVIATGPSTPTTDAPPRATPLHRNPPTPVAPLAPSSSPATTHAPAPTTPPGERIAQVPIEAIEPNRFQPRRAFDETQLAELAASIRSAGVVQPILVRPGAQAGRYELVAGERRWRAGKIAGLKHIPAVIWKLSDEQAAEWALVENIQRADLSPMERAWAVRGLCERFGLTHAQVGEKLGIDRTSAANLFRLTELEQDVRDLLDSGQLSAGHGKVLLGAPAGAVRMGLAKQAASQGWSVRRLEQAVSRAGQAPTGAAPGVQISDGARAKALAVRELEKQLGEHLATSVRIRAGEGGKRGTIVIKFFDLDHFDGLMAKMGFNLR